MAGPFRRTDLGFPIFLIFTLAFIHDATCARLEPGVEKFNLATSNLSKDRPVFAVKAFEKSMFEETAIKIIVSPEEVFCNTSFTVAWELRYTRCAQLYNAGVEELVIQSFMEDPSLMYSVETEISVIRNESDKYECDAVKSGTIHPQYPPSNQTTCYVSPGILHSEACESGTLLDAEPNVIAGTDDSKDTGTDDNKDTGTDDNKDTGTDDNKDTENPDGSRRRKRETDDNKGNDDSKDDVEPSKKTEDSTKEPPSTAAPKVQQHCFQYCIETRELLLGQEKKLNKSLCSDDRAAKLENTAAPKKKTDPDDSEKNVVTHTTVSGSYLLMLNISTNDVKGSVSFEVTVDMKGPNGYLSATQYPLLKFYGVMCGVYTLFGFTWLFLLCRQYQDLLGIQIWIGVVILLGLIEKAAFYGEYEHMNNKGTESSTGVMLAELVSCVKRTLARLLVVVVSIGYGITRPRLGTDLNYIMAAGLLYMTLSSAEAIMRVSETYEHSMVAVLPLSVLEAILVWWILRNLVDTTRTLRLRNNDTKLWLYRHFTNTLLLCVIFSIIFSIWSMKTHRFSECVEKHYELWLDDAFWHILFCVILFVVMILFRPSANNQRYAYSPLLDEEQEDEESKEPMLSEAYDGMKMRNLKKDNPQNAVKDIADDLKWVEDNIPAAIADSALAIMDDSEEELVTNLERSKMD